MEEILQLVVRGCEKSRELKENLHKVAGQNKLLLATCKAIAADFGNAIEKLSSAQAPGSGRRGEEASLGREYIAVPERATQPSELGPEITMSAEAKSVSGYYGRSSSAMGTLATAAVSSAQRGTRKRKEGCQTWTKRVPAAAGNSDVPPDDGYTWRKYGQKNILQSRFPRSYYRCTHKNFYGCNAKKQVQRLDDDPYTYEVTYCGDHSCRSSPTPYPIMNDAVAAGTELVPVTEAPCPSAISISAIAGTWFSMNIVAKNDDKSHAGETSGAAYRKLSHLPAGRDLDCSVADLADVMFNSRGGGGYLMM